MKFYDTAKITIRSGNGGDGCMAFLREKYRPKGGPSGGDGGKGGDILVRGDKGLYSLFDLSMNPHVNAGSGMNGMGKHMTGKCGVNKVIVLPFGTEIYNHETGELMLEVTDETESLLLPGGSGGLGNANFSGPRNRAPRKATTGHPGLEVILRLELKLLADVGLVGLPNAGKSTFISRVSKARPEIADYPFTTLRPFLGSVKIGYYSTFVIADIPGIIFGASEGKGLGLKFLRHVEKTSILAFLLDGSPLAEVEPLEAFSQLMTELENYSSGLTEKEKFVFITKSDTIDDEERAKINKFQKYMLEQGIQCRIISAVSGDGVDEALDLLANKVQQRRKNIAAINKEQSEHDNHGQNNYPTGGGEKSRSPVQLEKLG